MKLISTRLPKKYRKLDLPETIECAEFAFKSRCMPNGYRVTVAAIYAPSAGIVSIGSSACSPEDEFSAKTGQNIAFGRARQQLFTGLVKDGKASTPFTFTLLGTAGPGLFNVTENFVADTQNAAKHIRILVERVYAIVAANAEMRMLERAYRKLVKNHPNQLHGNILAGIIVEKIINNENKNAAEKQQQPAVSIDTNVLVQLASQADSRTVN